jgi:hypothetical protein
MVGWWSIGLGKQDNLRLLKLLFQSQELLGGEFLRTYIWNHPQQNHTMLLKVGFSVTQFPFRLSIEDSRKVAKTYIGRLDDDALLERPQIKNLNTWYIQNIIQTKDGIEIQMDRQLLIKVKK